MTEKKIYKDFNDWWSHGKHGYSSASRDIAEEIWADFEPTINASRDDYAALMLQEAREQKERYVEHLREVSSYVEEHNLEAVVGVNLYRWMLDRRLGRKRDYSPKVYQYKGNDYVVTGEVKFKDPASGDWVQAYQYVNRDDPGSVYVREKLDFEAKFEKVTETKSKE